MRSYTTRGQRSRLTAPPRSSGPDTIPPGIDGSRASRCRAHATHAALRASVSPPNVPLNRRVGRTFVPDEDMGEWTVHMDMPEGTSLAGTTENALKLLKELTGIEGVAQIIPSIGVIN